MKKLVLLCLFTTFCFAQKNEEQEIKKFDETLRIRLDEFKKYPMTSEEARTLKILAIEKIVKHLKDSSLVKETKEYLADIKTKKLDEESAGKVDLSKVPEDVLKKFKVETDKFSGITFVEYKKSSNQRYIYIGIRNKNPYLRFVWTYNGADWVFIKKIIFLIDDKKFEYIPQKVKREVITGSGVEEKVSDLVTAEMFPLLEALANTKNKILVRYEGDRVRDASYSKNLAESFKETLNLYNSL